MSARGCWLPMQISMHVQNGRLQPEKGGLLLSSCSAQAPCLVLPPCLLAHFHM